MYSQTLKHNLALQNVRKTWWITVLDTYRLFVSHSQCEQVLCVPLGHLCDLIAKHKLSNCATWKTNAWRTRRFKVAPFRERQVEGSYGILPATPAVGGNEGVGEITAVGPGVKQLAVGDWAIPMPAAGFGTWRNVAKADEVPCCV